MIKRKTQLSIKFFQLKDFTVTEPQYLAWNHFKPYLEQNSCDLVDVQYTIPEVNNCKESYLRLVLEKNGVKRILWIGPTGRPGLCRKNPKELSDDLFPYTDALFATANEFPIAKSKPRKLRNLAKIA